MNDGKIKLINPRGRIVWVKPSEVSKFLQRGFLHPPSQTGDYNPIFDRFKQTLPASVLQRAIESSKDTLEADKI